jgi:polar amino acid transport system substrate-binding protein
MFRSTCLSFLIALLASGYASAASMQEYCSGPVRVALFEFGVLYRASTNDGIDTQLLDEIQKHTGCEFKRVLLPRNRIWAELQNGSLDLATGAIPTPERRAYGYLLPYLKSRNLVLIRKDLALPINSLADLESSKLRIGVVRGFRHETPYDELIARLTDSGRIIKAADVSENLRLFDEGIVDVIFSQPIVFRQYLSQDYLDRKVAFRDLVPKDDVSIGALILSRKSFSPEQARKWDALVVKLQKDASLLRIYKNFLNDSQARDLIYTGPRSPE